DSMGGGIPLGRLGGLLRWRRRWRWRWRLVRRAIAEYLRHAYPGSTRRRRRSQLPRAGGATIASTIASAVSTLSINLFGPFAPTLTTCPVTAIGPLLATGLGPVDGGGARLPGDGEREPPGDGELPPAPGVVALPLTTTQFSGLPSLSHGDGF